MPDGALTRHDQLWYNTDERKHNMKTLGSLLAGIILSAIIIGICKLGHRYGFCNCGDYANTTTNETHGGRSTVLPFMANPVHNWHPANINHVYRH